MIFLLLYVFAVFEFSSESGDWVRKGTDIHGVAVDDHSGFAVALDGNGTTLAGVYACVRVRACEHV